MKIMILVLQLLTTAALANSNTTLSACRCKNANSPSSRLASGEPRLAERLFTLDGVTLAETSISQLEQMGARLGNQNYYNFNKHVFWYNPANGLVYSVVKQALRHDTWPHSWQALGLRQEMSYKEILLWMQAVGFRPIETADHQLEGTMITARKVFTIKLSFIDQRLSGVALLAVPRP